MIKKLMMMFVAIMAAMGAWAEISLGDTYRWVTEDEYVDGVREFDSEFVKSFGIYVYTGFWKSEY